MRSSRSGAAGAGAAATAGRAGAALLAAVIVSGVAALAVATALSLAHHELRLARAWSTLARVEATLASLLEGADTWPSVAPATLNGVAVSLDVQPLRDPWVLLTARAADWTLPDRLRIARREGRLLEAQPDSAGLRRLGLLGSGRDAVSVPE